MDRLCASAHVCARSSAPAGPIGGAIQALIAFGLGYLMDRALSFMLRRRALSAQSDPTAREDSMI
jgi:hypothetical protein